MYHVADIDRTHWRMFKNGDGVSPEHEVLGLPVLPRLVPVQDTFRHPTHVGDLVRRGKIEIEGDALQVRNRFILGFESPDENTSTFWAESAFVYSDMIFIHLERTARSATWITPVLEPFMPRTSNEFALSLSVPKMYLVT